MPQIFYSWLFYFMLAHLILLVYLFWANIKYLYQEVKRIDKKIWIILLLVFLFGFYLRNSEYWLGPHTDGYVAQESAHMWVLHGEFVKSCALGNHEDCKIYEQVLAPPGFPFIISLSHLIFGIHSLNASVISAILSSLTILLTFLIAYLVSKKEEIGLYAALIFSLIPINIVNSQTGLSRPTGLFFTGLTILFYYLAIKNNKIITWLLAAVCLSYAIYVRQESYILLPFLILFTILYKWKHIKNFFIELFINGKINFRLILCFLLTCFIFLILQIPVLSWLLFDNPYNSYQGGGFFALHYKGVLIQGQAILMQFFNHSPVGYDIFHYNIVSSVLFFLGLLIVFIFPNKNKFFIFGLFFSYFIVYSFMFDGNVYGTGGLTGDYFRRSLMFCLPYSIIAGCGIYILNPFKNKKYLPFSLVLCFLLIIFFIIINVNISLNHSWESSNFRSFTQNYNFYFPKSFLKDTRETKSGDRTLIYPGAEYWSATSKTPNDCLIITSQHMIITNDYFENNNRKTALIDLINYNNPNLFLEEFADNNCVIYFEDYRCDNNYQDGNDYACQFLIENLEKEFLFQEGEIKVYSAKLKNNIYEI